MENFEFTDIEIESTEEIVSPGTEEQSSEVPSDTITEEFSSGVPEQIEGITPEEENSSISVDKDSLLKILLENTKKQDVEEEEEQKEIEVPEIDPTEQSEVGSSSGNEISIPDYSGYLDNLNQGMKDIKETTTEMREVQSVNDSLDFSSNINDIGLHNSLLVLIIVLLMFDLVFHFIERIF